MYISHLFVAPLLLHCYFPSTVKPTVLVMASAAPDIVSNLYLITMELMRVAWKQKMEIHDPTKPLGWIEFDSGKPFGVGECTHSLRGSMWLAGSLSLLMGLYHATWKPAHMKTSPTTPPTTPETTAEKKIAPPEVPPPDTIAAKLIGPHIYLAMFAMWLAVMSHIFLDTVGENPKALLRPFSLLCLASSSISSNCCPNYHQTPIYSPTWTFATDSSLALLTTYLYSLNPHISRQSRLHLAGLTTLLMIVEGDLYLPRISSLVITTTAPTTAPSVWWSLIRHVCGAALVGTVLERISRHSGDVGEERERAREMLRRGMEAVKGEVGEMGDLPSLPSTPYGEKTYEVGEVEQSTVEEALGGRKNNQEMGMEKEKEKQRGVKRDSGFWGDDNQETGTPRPPDIEHGGAGEGVPLRKSVRRVGVLPEGRVKLSSLSTDPHQEKRRRRGSHGTYADVLQGKGHPETGDESPVFVDEPGRATGYSYGQGLPGAGGGRSGEGGGTKKAYIH